MQSSLIHVVLSCILCNILSLRLLSSQKHLIGSHMHKFSHEVPASKSNYHLFSFFPSTVRDWNNLSLDVVEAQSVHSFRTKLAAGHLLEIILQMMCKYLKIKPEK